jgi:hypothetical protein
MRRVILELGPEGMAVRGPAAKGKRALPCVCGPYGNCAASCPNRPKPRRAAPEAAIQRAIIDRLRLYGVLCVAVPNEGKRSRVAGARLKGTGMRPGFPDLICMQDGQAAFLEVKVPRGVVSDAQRDMHEELQRQRMLVAVVRSQDEAVTALRGWGFAC